MLNTFPKISVLLPAYNAEKYLNQAIESILNQTLEDFELLIIDDASTDHTATIIASYQDPRIRVIRNPTNLGLTKSLNLGLHQSQGNFIARLDADDISLPQRLAQQIYFLEQHPETVLVGSLSKLINGAGETFDYQKSPTDPEIIKFSLLFGNPITHSSIFFRKKPILEMGGYNERFRYAQDFELYSRLVTKYQLTVLPELLVKYRSHDQSLTLNQSSRQDAEDAALLTVLNNWQKYLPLSSPQWLAIKKSLFVKNSSPTTKELLLTLLLTRRLWRSYCRLEKLSPETVHKLAPHYHRYLKLTAKKIFH